MKKATDAELELASFLGKYTEDISVLAEGVLAEMRKLYPAALELVYDNYNALAIGFGPSERASEAIFSIALYPKWVSLFFLQAKGLPDPENLLRGSGSVAKHIVLSSPAMLHEPAVQALMREAVIRAKVPFDPNGTRCLIIKSISENQRPRRPGGEASKRTVPSGKRSRAKGAS
jgi:hypothetical protein